MKPVVIRPHTTQFIKDMEELRETKRIASDKEVYQVLGIQQCNFSSILNGRRNISMEKVLLFQEKFQNEIKEISAEITLPLSDYVEMLRRENELLRMEVKASLALLATGQQSLQLQIAALAAALSQKEVIGLLPQVVQLNNEDCPGYEPVV